MKLKMFVFAAVAAIAAPAYGQTVLDFSTSSSNSWTITAANLVNVIPDYTGLATNNGIVAPCIGITSNGSSPGWGGVPLSGLDLGDFDGFWAATYTFFLPSGAKNVTLNYWGLNVDDRCVLELNGTPIGSTGINSPGGGNMQFTDGGPNNSYYFNGPDGEVSGTVANGFIIGGTNTITAIINNTEAGIYGSDQPLIYGTGFGIDGTISYNTSSLNQGLVAWYPFNGNANDASCNGLKGTLHNSPSFISGPVSGSEAIYLNGANGQYVSIPSIDLSVYNAFTISMWVDIQGETEDAGELLICFGELFPTWNSGPAVGIDYYLGRNTYDFGAGNASFSATPLHLNQWHRYSLVYSGGVLTGYLDGQVVGTATGSMVSTAGNAGMGTHWWDFGASQSTRFIGSMSDVRIYSRALSSQEISTLAGLPPPCSAYLNNGNNLPNGSWSGYIAGLPPSNDPSGTFQANAVTDVKGTWVVPELNSDTSPNGVFATWIGIGGWYSLPCSSDDTAFVQIGVGGYYDGSGTPKYYAWYETPGFGGVVLNPVVVIPNFPVAAGDKISAEVSYIPEDNVYSVWIMDFNQSVSDANPFVTFVNQLVQDPANHAKTAEWIVENAGGAPIAGTVPPQPLGNSLADFGTVNFSGCSVTLNSGGNSETGSINSLCNAAAYGIQMFNSATIMPEAEPINLTSDGTSFAVTYQPQTSSGTLAISITDSPSDGGTNSGSVNVYSNQVVTVTATPNSCFSFENWTENGIYLTNSPTYTFIATNNRNLTANFLTNIYTITTSSSPSEGGTVTGATTTNCGSTVTLVASNNPGYSFAGWTWISDGMTNWVSDSSTFTFAAVANSNLVANFVPLGSSLITTVVYPPSAGSVTGGGPYTNGVSATISATAAPCYAFLYWTTNGVPFSFSPTNMISVTTHEVFTANFALISYNIAASASSGGTVSGGGSYNCGNAVTLFATPNSCYSFVNWTENGNPVSSSSAFYFVVDTNHNFVANFAPISSTVSTTSSPANAGTTGGGGTFGCEFSTTMTAIANSGWAFANWTENGVSINTSSNFTLTGSGNHSLVANFAPNVLLGFGSPLWSTNGFGLMLQGPIGSNYEVDLSTDLFIWLPTTNFQSTSSPFYFSIPPATNANQGFYRALMQ